MIQGQGGKLCEQLPINVVEPVLGLVVLGLVLMDFNQGDAFALTKLTLDGFTVGQTLCSRFNTALGPLMKIVLSIRMLGAVEFQGNGGGDAGNDDLREPGIKAQGVAWIG